MLASRVPMRYARMFMRFPLLKVVGLVIVGVCLGGHISELFDRWEPTLVGGNDIDYTCVVVAAVAGAVIVISGMLGRFFPTSPRPLLAPLTQRGFVVWSTPGSVSSAHSPPLSLRI